MSIDYYAVPTMDEDTVRSFIAGEADALTLSIPRMAALLRVVEALQAEQLYVWDPQNNDWLSAD